MVKATVSNAVNLKFRWPWYNTNNVHHQYQYWVQLMWLLEIPPHVTDDLLHWFKHDLQLYLNPVSTFLTWDHCSSCVHCPFPQCLCLTFSACDFSSSAPWLWTNLPTAAPDWRPVFCSLILASPEDSFLHYCIQLTLRDYQQLWFFSWLIMP